jgi:hypothetical protein
MLFRLTLPLLCLRLLRRFRKPAASGRTIRPSPVTPPGYRRGRSPSIRYTGSIRVVRPLFLCLLALAILRIVILLVALLGSIFAPIIIVLTIFRHGTAPRVLT